MRRFEGFYNFHPNTARLSGGAFGSNGRRVSFVKVYNVSWNKVSSSNKLSGSEVAALVAQNDGDVKSVRFILISAM